MTSNYNVLYLESPTHYKVGDIYTAPINADWRIQKFNGLKVESIGYWFEMTVLYFDYNSWEQNEVPRRGKLTNNGSNHVPKLQW